MSRKLVAVCLALSATASAQTPPPPGTKPSFEVASVRPNTAGQMSFSWGVTPGGRVTARNLTVWNLIRFAYHLRDLQMTGGPSWIKSEGFDITAQPPSSLANPSQQVGEMLQGLLQDRFKLVVHRETREGPVYELRIGKNGPKFQPTPPDRPKRPNVMKIGDLMVEKMEMAQLANILEFDVERPVIDRTGLTEQYDIRLQWTRQREGSDADPAAIAALPSIFTAVQEQLGLRLEAAKGPVEMLVIDSVSRPGEN